MTHEPGNTDRIEKQVVLRAPRERVWRAVSEAGEFGAWFGVDLSGATFVPGATVTGKFFKAGCEHLTLEIVIDRVEPDRIFSFRWHPYGVDPSRSYADEPMTLVVFELRDVPEGTLLTVTESGFDRIPLERRAEAFAMNDRGWAAQMRNVDAYLARSA